MDRLFIFYDCIDKEIVVIRNGREFKSVGCVVFQIAVCYVILQAGYVIRVSCIDPFILPVPYGINKYTEEDDACGKTLLPVDYI